MGGLYLHMVSQHASTSVQWRRCLTLPAYLCQSLLFSQQFSFKRRSTSKGYSGFTYRPFTLEGNFAYASAIQEMLLQSHTGVIRVFPALPESWQEASFQNMRAVGGFLVTADYREGRVKQISIHSEKGGWMKVFNPFTQKVVTCRMKPGETFHLSSPEKPARDQ